MAVARRKRALQIPVSLPIVNQKLVKMRYSKSGGILLPTASVVRHTFRANSVYDPDWEVGGGTASGYEFWLGTNGLYNHYAVVGAVCRFTVYTFGGVPHAMYLAVHTADDATHTFNWEEVRGSGTAPLKNFSGNNVGGKYSVIGHFSAKKFFNVKDVKDNILRIGAAVGANPSEYALFHCDVGVCDANPITVTAGFMDYTVELEYLVLCSEPRDLQNY